MTKSAKATKSVYANVDLNHRNIMRPWQQRRSVVFISKITPLITVFMGLFYLAGCQDTEAKKRLEMTLESQALQMAALNDKLARCEHQWQTNTEELMRYNQVTMRDLEAFRQEQNSLRTSVFGMDERWAVQHEYIRNRQGQVQQSLVDLDQKVQKTDAHLAHVNAGLNESITYARDSLSTGIKDISTTATATQTQVIHVRHTAEAISEDVNSVQQQNHALYARMTDDNKDMDGKLQSMLTNQQALRASLSQTQITATRAVDGINTANSKQDQVLAWSQVHSQRVDDIDKAATLRHSALTEEVKKVQGQADQLAAEHQQIAQQTGMQFNKLEDVSLQHKQQLTDFNDVLVNRHRALETQLTKVVDLGQTVSNQIKATGQEQIQSDQALTEKLNGLNKQHEQLASQIHKIDTTTTAIAGQLQQDHQSQQTSSLGIRQQVTDLDKKWTQEFAQRHEDQEALANKHQNNLTQQLETLKDQGTALGQKIDQSVQSQIQQAEAAQKDRHDLANQQQKQLQTINQDVLKNRTTLGEQIHKSQAHRNQLANQQQNALGNLEQGQKKLTLWTEHQNQLQTEMQTSTDQRHQAITGQLQQIQSQNSELGKNLTQNTQAQAEQSTAAHEHRSRLATQEQERLAGLQDTMTKEHKDLQRDVNNFSTATATAVRANQQANKDLEQTLSSLARQQAQLLAKSEQQGQQLGQQLNQAETVRLSQFNNLENQVKLVQQSVTLESGKIQAGQSQLSTKTQVTHATENQNRQLSDLQKQVVVQGQGLESMNQNILVQLTEVAKSQTQLQQAVKTDQSTTTSTIEKHSLDLQTQLKHLTTILRSLEGRLDQTSKDLDKSVKNGSEEDLKASRELKQELDTLRQTVSLITHTQQVIQQQLMSLQSTVKEQHQSQSKDLVEIKEKVSKAPAEPVKPNEEGS